MRTVCILTAGIGSRLKNYSEYINKSLLPIKNKSVRVPRKNFKKIGKKTLYEITLEKLKKCNFDEVYIDTDSDEIKKYCEIHRINIINRIPSLSKNSANGNDLLNYHAEIIDSDIYFQLFMAYA